MAYGTVSFASGLVTECELVDEGFRVGTDAGQAFVAKRVLFATGIKDELLPVPGFEACWGKTIAHCPYCHGYELRGRSTAIISNGDHTAGFYRLIGNWTPDLTLLTNGQADFDRSELPAGVNIVESRITEIIHTNGRVERVLLADGTAQPVGALYYAPPFTQHCPLPERMGCAMLDSGHIETDQFGATSVAGVYAAGDCTTPLRALAVAAARGCVAGSGINHSLVG